MSITDKYRANKKLGNLVIAMALAAVIHNFPQVLNWLPPESAQTIQTAAYAMLNGLGVILVAWWAKQYNTSGTGAPMDPYTKPAPDGGTREMKP